jgi:tRNA modification GTPase
MFTQESSSIVACASGNGANSAVAIIRISGFQKIEEFNKYFKFNLNDLRPRFCSLNYFVLNNTIKDQVLLVYFPAPASFTGENVLEIHSHGNQLIVQLIINSLVNEGHCKPAKAGEFTYRALVNKKISLSEVEGLDLILNAQTSHALNHGQSLLFGELNQSYQLLKNLFLEFKASVELNIDFLEDIGSEQGEILLNQRFLKLIEFVESLTERIDQDHDLISLPMIGIFGSPNAGKSTLFNKLLNNNRALVSSTPGTTRDFISERITIGGSSFLLVDTAGIHESIDQVEKLGIEKSLSLIDKSFFKILVINPFLDFDFNKWQAIPFDLVIFSHSDLPGFDKLINNFKYLNVLKYKTGPIGPVLLTDKLTEQGTNFGPIGPDRKIFMPNTLGVSGPIGPLTRNFASKTFGPIGPEGPEELLNLSFFSHIINKYNNLYLSNSIILPRHKSLFFKIKLIFNDLSTSIKNGDYGVISFHSNQLSLLINELIGQISPDEVLEEVFANFCIGK